MTNNIANDQLAVIRVEGMHCHGCERTLKKTLLAQTGVHEVEVDFNTGQLSVLFNKTTTGIRQLMDKINQAGYHAASFTLARQIELPKADGEV